jgi:hypothetical protein
MHRRLLVVVLLLVAAGCARDTLPPPPPAKEHVAMFRIGASSDTMKDDLAARFAEADIDAKLRRIRDLPRDEIPAWAQEYEDGWLAFVNAKQQDQARAVWKAYLASFDMRPVEKTPPAPLVLGEAKPVAAETLASIKAELQKRLRLDQAVRKDRKRHHEMQQVDADNTAWLRQVAVEHGWLDAQRFGTEAADAAFLLVQHSGDLPLMTAALPTIEGDVKAGRLHGQTFALLYDRLQLMQGGQQRYGTQVMKVDEKGDWVLRRLEDPDRVDERRKAMGLGPLKEYLSGFGHPVRIER